MVNMLLCVFWVALVLMFPIMDHPLSMGLTLLILGVMSCLVLSLDGSTWYAMIVYIIYIGALLVMFSYIAVMVPSPNLSHYKKLPVIIVFSLVLSGLMMGGVKTIRVNEDMVDGIQVVDGINTYLLIFYGGVLLITLLVVAALCQSFKAPLRSFEK